MRDRSNIPPRKPYNPTPLGPEYTDEERRRMRELVPRGVYPRTYRKGQIPTKTSYFVPVVRILDTDGHRVVTPDYAELLIASIPEEYGLHQRREYWEHSLLVAYYHLYGNEWSHWRTILPWVRQHQIPLRAEEYRCEMPWDWSEKKRFLSSNGFRWNLPDLNRLIDRYPDYQRNYDTQDMYIPGKTFEELQQVADALNLPTAKTLELLAEYALELSRAQQ